MQTPLSAPVPGISTPRFYVTRRQPLSPTAIFLAIVVAAAALTGVLYGLSRSGRVAQNDRPGASRASRGSSGDPTDDDKDDPNQIDTIVLGDPADPPAPARTNNHVSPVHPTVLVRLPRFGKEVGLIPNSPAGRLLYAWLAAFNQANASALGDALPSAAFSSTVEAELLLRQQTGGFTLVSAREVTPGIVAFRLHDQTAAEHEFLGALEMRPYSEPATIATFSLAPASESRQ